MRISDCSSDVFSSDRGAVGADPLVGDGAGILIQIPDELLRDWAEGAGVVLPQPGDYAVAMCFMPRDENARTVAVEQFSRFVRNEGQVLPGWRDVPVNTDGICKKTEAPRVGKEGVRQ